MRVLIDSAALIWWFAADDRLGSGAAELIEDPSTEAYVSVASAWEIGMKKASGKLRVEGDVPDWLEAGLMYDLPVRMRHAQAAAALPMHHRDPFDRMLVAQAIAEGLVLITPDEALRRYEVPLIDARA
jgi:PIN domain nuclease of toxin-antitoxin system